MRENIQQLEEKRTHSRSGGEPTALLLSTKGAN